MQIEPVAWMYQKPGGMPEFACARQVFPAEMGLVETPLYAHRLAALSARPDDRAVQDMLKAAYMTGAKEVHQAWIEGSPGRDPDFTEAASDYAASVIAALGEK